MKRALSLLVMFAAIASSCFAQQQRVKKPMTLTIAAAPLVIQTSALPSGKVGEVFQSILFASQGTPPYTWTLDTGSTLPTGLTLGNYFTMDEIPVRTDEGVIKGIPTVSGTFSFTVVVTDSGTPPLVSKLKVTMQAPKGL